MGFQRVEHDLVTKQQQQYGSEGKASVYNAGDLVRSLGREDSLEKVMATHSSTLA